MEHHAEVDVSLKDSRVCVVDAAGRVVREAKVTSEPEALIAWLRGLGIEVARIGLKAGPLSQRLQAGLGDTPHIIEAEDTGDSAKGGGILLPR